MVSEQPPTTAAALVDQPPGVVRKAIAASAIGNATEWFDYGIYAYGVTYISAAMFPEDLPPTTATLLTLLTFAVSFLVRPLGGMIWGPLGDRLGRKRVLAITILMMAGATLCVGLIPSYSVIGVGAPILLVILRMIQGFSTGGEYGGAATFMAEYAPCRKRGFLGSFLEVGTLAGFSLGALLMLGFSLGLGDDQMHAWGWRLPFLVAAPLGLVGIYLRTRLEDTPIFRELEVKGEKEEKATTAFRDLLAEYWRPILKLGGLVVALNVVNYTLLAYMPTYLENEIGLSTNMSLVVPIIGMLTMMVFLPFAGTISDRIGRKPVWWFSLAGLFVAGVPMFLLMGTGLAGAVIGFAVPALRAPTGDDLGDLPRHVPDARAIRRHGDRLQRVDLAVRWYGSCGQRMADRADWRRAGTRLLHDGRLRRRGHCAAGGPRDHEVPDQRKRDPRHRESAAAGRVRGGACSRLSAARKMPGPP
jgi:MHS family proline/betaine transporter-like MFS transporter